MEKKSKFNNGYCIVIFIISLAQMSYCLHFARLPFPFFFFSLFSPFSTFYFCYLIPFNNFLIHVINYEKKKNILTLYKYLRNI